MTKLMAFDVDGTILLDNDIAQRTQAALHRWHDAGHLTVCNTGRSMEAMHVGLGRFELPFDYYVLYTGAVLADAHLTVLDAHTLPQQPARDIIQHFQEAEDVGVFAASLTKDYDLTPGKVKESIVSHFHPTTVEELAQEELVVVPLIIEAEQVRAQAYQWITEHYGTQLDCQHNQHIVDVVPQGATKASGLARLLETQLHLNRSEVEIYTIGDSWNDIPMHEYADISAAFSYSPQPVQQAATRVVDHAYEFVEWALEQ